MLRALNIRNFALVPELDIEFAAGLTVITGESGAGKSILLDALGLVLGARAKRSQLRPGTDGCDVSAEFDIAEQPACQATLAELALSAAEDDTACLVRRTAGEGRSRAFVNSVPATLSVLQNVTEPLVDIHGQHEHRQLLLRDVQRRLLDEFGVPPELVEQTAQHYREHAALAERLAERRQAVASANERERLLRYQIEELEGLGDTIGQVDELIARHRRLAKAQDLLAAITSATAELDDAVLPGAARLATALEGVDDDHASLRAAAELAATAQTHLDEALAELRRYRDALSAGPEAEGELATLDETLGALHDMARKHRVPVQQLAAHLAELTAELATLAASATELDDLATAAAAARESYLEAGKALSEARRAAAPAFAAQVTSTLAELGLAGASMTVQFAAAESAAGLETVEFFATTNPRYPAATLRDIASGGELARFSLAIQVVAAERSRLPCLILDEADIGVGGTTADVLGRMLRRLSTRTQVIAITHAPQLAALGDSHFRVSKTDDQNTVIAPLDEDERVAELARMLGGREITEDTRRYARTLLAEARDGA